MRFPLAPPPFTERIAVVGTLSAEGRSTGPLDILIDVSNTGARSMRGWVLGNRDTQEQIERTQGSYRDAMRLDGSNGGENITSPSIWIRSTQSFDADHEVMPKGLVGIACAFDCLDLTRRFETTSEARGRREIRFLVRGPSVRGLVAWSFTYSFEGWSKVKVVRSPLATGGGLPFSMFVLPHFLHHGFIGREDRDDHGSSPDEAAVTSQTHTLVLVCRTRKTASEYADGAFLTDARQAVEDMCLLLSLLAGGRIAWHAWHQSAADALVRHSRSLGPGTDAGRSEDIVARHDLRDFLRRAFKRLRRLRAEGIDLEMPIVSAIAGAQAQICRQRFGEFFLALEAMHSIELERLGRTFLLDPKIFRRVKSGLKEPLASALRAEDIRSGNVAEQMTQKLTELNRPALWHGVSALMQRLRVDWEDLYSEPAPERPTFLRLRNVLFHSHDREDEETVLKESVRVEAVVHRLLLRWLGWEDLWEAPTPDVRHFLSGKALPDHHRLVGRHRRKRQRRPPVVTSPDHT